MAIAGWPDNTSSGQSHTMQVPAVFAGIDVIH